MIQLTTKQTFLQNNLKTETEGEGKNSTPSLPAPVVAVFHFLTAPLKLDSVKQQLSALYRHQQQKNFLAAATPNLIETPQNALELSLKFSLAMNQGFLLLPLLPLLILTGCGDEAESAPADCSPEIVYEKDDFGKGHDLGLLTYTVGLALEGQARGYTFLLQDETGRELSHLNSGYAVYPDRCFTTETKFHVGSISKMVTTALVLHAIEQGDIEGGLETKMAEQLPCRWDKYVHEDFKDVTIEHLMQHRSGITTDDPFPDVLAKGVQVAGWSGPPYPRSYHNHNFYLFDHIYAYMVNPEWMKEFETHCEQPSDLDDQRHIVARATELYRQHATEKVLIPAEVTAPITCDMQDVIDEGGEYSLGYEFPWSEEGKVHERPWYGACGVGRWIFTARDLASFLHTLKNKPGVILSAETYAKMDQANLSSELALGYSRYDQVVYDGPVFSHGGYIEPGHTTANYAYMANYPNGFQAVIYENSYTPEGGLLDNASILGNAYNISFHENNFGLDGKAAWGRDALEKGSAQSGDGFGQTLAAGDFNGDGYEDLAVGLEGKNLVQVIDGKTGSFENIELGSAKAESLAVGYFNKDTFADLAIGKPHTEVNGQAAAGEVQIVYGSENGMGRIENVSVQSFGQTENIGDLFGKTLSVGDFDGNGLDDLAIGIPLRNELWNDERENLGAVGILYGLSEGLDQTNAQKRDQYFMQGNLGTIPADAFPQDRFGSSLAAGDFNRDGFQDLAVGMPGRNLEAGAVRVLFGSDEGVSSSPTQYFEEGRDILELHSPEPSDHFGEALAAGDFNGDGADDLVVGVPNQGAVDEVDHQFREESGALHIIDGPFAADQNPIRGAYYNKSNVDYGALTEFEHFGSVLVAGDFNGDGLADLVVGVPEDRVLDNVHAGSLQYFLGAPEGFFRDRLLYQSGGLEYQPGRDSLGGWYEAGDLFGNAVAIGDFDGDGKNEIAIGVPGEDVGYELDGEFQYLQNAGVVQTYGDIE